MVMTTLLTAFLSLAVGAVEPATTTERLAAACEKNMEHWDRVAGKFQKIGASLDQFCEGYLVGTFEALESQKLICAKDSERPRAEFLASVVQTYIGSNKNEKARPAQDVVRRALERAFACTTSQAR